MRTLLILFSLFCSSAFAGAISTHSQTLSFEGKKYRLDFYSPALDGRRHPGIILVPDYWGKDELDKAPAEKLAQAGFVVAVLDIYGEGAHTKVGKTADKFQAEAEEAGSITNLLSLISLGLDQLKLDKDVDSNNLAAMGFGYGGGLVWNLAKRGEMLNLRAVVSFYGGTRRITPIVKTPRSVTSFLYLRPEYDVYTTKQEMSDFEHELTVASYDYKVIRFPTAQNSFIHPAIGSYGKDLGNSFMIYDAKAAADAWTQTIAFLHEKLKPLP